jgi:hypothetical protein
MELAGCGCSDNIQNTGNSTQKLFKLTTGKYWTPAINSDGERNGLDLTLSPSALKDALIARINEADPTKRFYPILGITNVLPEETDATYATSDTNERTKLFDGIKTVNFQYRDASNQYFAKLQNVCVDFTEFSIDACGSILGQKEGTTLYGRPVNQASYDAKFMELTTAETSIIAIQYDYVRQSSDANQWMITSTELDGFDANTFSGLVGGAVAVGTITSTSIIVDVTKDFGTAVTRQPLLGLQPADIVLTNTTTPASITVSAVTPDATVKGRYELTIPAQTASDAGTIKIFKASATGLVAGFESNLETLIFA